MNKNNIQEVLNAIEKLRKELNTLNLNDPKLIKKSQELDKLLNDYYSLIKKEK